MARSLSELSTALNVTVSAVASRTEKDASPSVPVVCEVGVISAFVEEGVSVTVLPATGLEPSSKVTVTVPVVCNAPLVVVATIGVDVVTVDS